MVLLFLQTNFVSSQNKVRIKMGKRSSPTWSIGQMHDEPRGRQTLHTLLLGLHEQFR